MRDSQIQEPIVAFLADAERRLRRHVPAEKLAAVLEEAKCHLNERAETLMAAGATQEQAEATAVASFDDVGRWSRSIILAMYSDRYTDIARRVAVSGAAFAIAAPALVRCVPSNGYVFLAIMALGLLAVAVGSFRARRYFPAVIVGIGVVASVLAFPIGGATLRSPQGVDGAWTRHGLRDLETMYLPPIAFTRSEIGLLRLGLRTYAHGATATVPTELRTADGNYIVPWPESERRAGKYIGQSAFKKWLRPSDVPANATQAVIDRIEAQLPDRSVATPAEAARSWRVDGPTYLRDDLYYLSIDQADLDRIRQAETRPAGTFDVEAGQSVATGFLFVAGLALIIHFWMACLGRLVYRLRRRNPMIAA